MLTPKKNPMLDFLEASQIYKCYIVVWLKKRGLLIAILKFLRHIGDKVLCDDENVKIFKEGHTFVQECGRFKYII